MQGSKEAKNRQKDSRDHIACDCHFISFVMKGKTIDLKSSCFSGSACMKSLLSPHFRLDWSREKKFFFLGTLEACRLLSTRLWVPVTWCFRSPEMSCIMASRRSRRSHVSSGSDDDGTRFADAAPAASAASFQPYTAKISAFATAILVPNAACHALWGFLLSGERKALVSCSMESDSWCLKNIRAVEAERHDAESSCEDVFVDQPRPAEALAAIFGRSFAAEADATRGFSDRHLALVDDVTSMRHQLSLMAMRVDTQESLIDWLQDRDREATEEKMRLLTMLRKQAAVLDEQKQELSALSELVSRLRNDFYGQAIDRSLARSRSPPVDRAARAPITPPTTQERRAPETPP